MTYGHKTEWCHHAAKEGVPQVTPESAMAGIEKKKKKKAKVQWTHLVEVQLEQRPLHHHAAVMVKLF